MPRDQRREVPRPDTDYIDDPDVWEHSLRGPLVDRGGADAEKLRDLADGEELLDRR